jgi:hypothetical protein
MAGCALSQDIAGICLVLAGGDADMDLEEVMLEADRFMVENNRHFGISRTDLRGLFQSLFLWNLEDSHPLAVRLGDRWKEGAFDGIRLWEIVPVILAYHDAAFNDEGEHWCGLDDGADACSREWYEKNDMASWYGYDWGQYCGRVKIKEAMRELFHPRRCPGREAVEELMRAHGLDEKLLYHCSRRGRSS